MVHCCIMKQLSIQFVLFFAICLLSGCGDRSARSILPLDVQLIPGDVVLRQGNGLASRVVLMADRHSSYSHVGMVTDSAGVMMICHAVPGELDYEGDVDRVKLERPDKFFNDINASQGCVLRHIDMQTAQRAAEVAMDVYRRRTLFDHDYNEDDTTCMYCCELVEYAYTRVGDGLLDAGRHQFHVPGLDFDKLMLPSDFLSSSKLNLIKSF